MKIILSSRGSRGDVNPIIEVAATLNNSGHEAYLCVPEIFSGYSRQLGLEPILYPEDSKEVMENMGSGLGSMKGAFDFFSKSVNDQFNFMLDASENADALVTTINEVAAPTIAEYRKIPHYRVGFSPILPGKQAPPFMPWQRMPSLVNQLGWSGLSAFSKMVIRKFVDDKRRELGLKAVKNSNDYHTGNSHTLLAINPELAPPCPSWENRYKYDYTGYCYGQIYGPLEPGLKDFLDSGEAPVYIGFGSVNIENPEAFTNMIIEGAKQSGCRIIIGKGWTGLGNKDLDDTMYSVEDTQHGTLFPKLAGIIHHGGSGTTHTAARAGIPQFILPQFYDQHFWGHKIYNNGIGPRPVPPGKTRLKHIVSAMEGLTNGAYRASAENLAEHMKNEDGVAKIASIVMDNTR